MLIGQLQTLKTVGIEGSDKAKMLAFDSITFSSVLVLYLFLRVQIIISNSHMLKYGPVDPSFEIPISCSSVL